jgi:hypothetical protein
VTRPSSTLRPAPRDRYFKTVQRCELKTGVQGVPSLLQIKSLAAVGIPQEDIAQKIGIRSPKTLRKYFRKELYLAATDANASVGGALYNRAMEGNIDAQKFWLERPAGWRIWPTRTGLSTPPPFIVAREKKD